MLKLRKIAITGGVASGKSSVCQFFEELGAYVVKADAIVHELLTPNTDLGQQVIRNFGSEILENGKISRRIVAEIVFNSSEKLEKLEKLLHPAVLRRIEEFYDKAANERKYTSFVVEIPLLFEIKGEALFDLVIAVVTDEAIARKRFSQAGFQSEEYDKRMNRQLKPSEKANKANYIIYNNGSLDDLKKEVVKFIQTQKLTT